MSDGAMEICEFCHWLMQQCTCDKQMKALIKQLRAEVKELELELSTTLRDVAANTAPLDMVDQLRKENEKLLWAKEEQLQALADIINAVANETNSLNRARLILAKNRGEVGR